MTWWHVKNLLSVSQILLKEKDSLLFLFPSSVKNMCSSIANNPLNLPRNPDYIQLIMRNWGYRTVTGYYPWREQAVNVTHRRHVTHAACRRNKISKASLNLAASQARGAERKVLPLRAARVRWGACVRTGTRDVYWAPESICLLKLEQNVTHAGAGRWRQWCDQSGKVILYLDCYKFKPKSWKVQTALAVNCATLILLNRLTGQEHTLSDTLWTRRESFPTCFPCSWGFMRSLKVIQPNYFQSNLVEIQEQARKESGSGLCFTFSYLLATSAQLSS